MIATWTGYVVTSSVSDPRVRQSRFQTPAGESGQLNLVLLDAGNMVNGVYQPFDMTSKQATLSVVAPDGSLVISRQWTPNLPLTLGTGGFPLLVGDTQSLAPHWPLGCQADVRVTDSSNPPNSWEVVIPSDFVIMPTKQQVGQSVTTPQAVPPYTSVPFAPALVKISTSSLIGYGSTYQASGTITLTLPTAASAALLTPPGTAGILTIANVGTGVVTVNPGNGTDTLAGGTPGAGLTINPGETLTFTADQVSNFAVQA